jgi:hypothetical protein
MSNEKEVYELEIHRNAEGSKLAFMSVRGEGSGYRISGPKALGGSRKLEGTEIRQDDLVEFIKSYAPKALAELQALAERTSSAGSAVVMSDEQILQTWAQYRASAVGKGGMVPDPIEFARAILSAAAAQPAQKPYGWLTGESTGHRQGQLEHVTNYEFAKEICEENNKLNRQYDPEHVDVQPIPLYAAAQAKQSFENIEELVERMRDALAEVLGEAMDCTRVWSAWGYGTMSQDDFQVIANDDDRLDEIARAAVAVLTTNGDAAIGDKGNE